MGERENVTTVIAPQQTCGGATTVSNNTAATINNVAGSVIIGSSPVGVVNTHSSSVSLSASVNGSSRSSSAMKSKGPIRVGFYDIERTIGKGNFAVVKLARHRITRTEVSVTVYIITSMFFFFFLNYAQTFAYCLSKFLTI